MVLMRKSLNFRCLKVLDKWKERHFLVLQPLEASLELKMSFSKAWDDEQCPGQYSSMIEQVRNKIT
jgi:hypothetical protein